MEDVEYIRLLISDIGESPVFSDGEIDAILERNPVLEDAAAQLLEIIAANEALTSKLIASQGLKVDGPAVARLLLEAASRLRANAGSDVAIAETTVGHNPTPELQRRGTHPFAQARAWAALLDAL